MQTESLLERLRIRYTGKEPTGSGIDRVVKSIIRNLENILNQQQGSSLCAPDLGLPDLNAARFGSGLDSLRIYEREIENCIMRYEPRARQVKARHEGEGGKSVSLNFRVSISVEYDGEIVPLVFETVMGMDGHIFIENGRV